MYKADHHPSYDPLKDPGSRTLPELDETAIHIWHARLVVTDARWEQCLAVLSRDELARAERYRFEPDRRRFGIARAYLREILAAYTKCDPRTINFSYSEQGKPSLAHPATDLRFNLSHSEEQAVLALTLGREIGVDIERTRSDVACDEIAQRFFSPAERDQLRATPPDLQIAAFFRVWTCKEAFLKAHGAGLSVSLDSFEVEADPAKPPALLATRPDPREAVCWSLRHLDVPPGFAAAVAVRGQLGNVQSMVWQ